MGLAHSSGHAAANPFTWWPLKYEEQVVCLSSLLSSSPHQHGHNLKPQALLALKQSCLTQSAHIPPVAVDSYTNSSRDPHTRRRVLFLSHSSDCLASPRGCQPCASRHAEGIYSLHGMETAEANFHLHFKNEWNLAAASQDDSFSGL